MKRLLILTAFCLTFVAGAAFSYVRDWHDLDAVHRHVSDALREMDRARAANHFDMAGHGARASEHLRAAEHELSLAVESARKE
jgi:hypothetical protein